MSEGGEDLRQRVQEQILRSVQDFRADSLGRLRGQLREDRAQLEQVLAEQLPEGDALALIRRTLDFYSQIEGLLDRAAHDLPKEAEAAQKGQETGGQATQGPQDTAAGGADQAAGAATQLVDQAGQVAGGAQEAVGEALGEVAGYVGQVSENLPGGQLLSRTTDEAGQTVQRAVDGSGSIVEITLDKAGNLAQESLVGSLTDLPAEEEHQDEEGQTIRTVKDESGTLIELRLDEDGSILDLRIPPDA